MNKYEHKAVLLDEAIDSLNIHPNGIYVDGTFGCGGHSKAILSKLGKNGTLIAIDRDPSAISIAKTIKDHRLFAIHGTFSKLADYIQEKKLIGKVNGILLDLGVSSLQIENAKRGFSFMQDGPLDMRMDQTYGKSAAEWLCKAKETDIVRVLKIFGEERFSRRIANAIVKRNRSLFPITRTKELSEIVINAIPMKGRSKHPARRTFQAIRIFVNSELQEIELLLRSSLDILTQGGRLSVISFHSLEDRIVKRFMLSQSFGLKFPSKLPITEEHIRKLKKCYFQYLGKVTPGKKEIVKNSRARSAILRFAERTKQ